MFKVHQAHHIHPLMEALASQMEADPLAPMEREVVVVESRGLARRLPLELTRLLGATARLHMPMPAAFIWDSLLLPFAEGGLEHPSPWGKEALAWRICALLAEEPALAGPGETLLRKKGGERAARDLGQRLADLFDQYLVFRPGMLLAWQGGPHADFPGALKAQEAALKAPWQKRLWLRLREQTPAPTRADLMARWLLESTEQDVKALPRRIGFFNLRGLPPAQLKLVERLSQWRQVDFYLANPSPTYYWTDLACKRRRREALDVDEAPLIQANGQELGQWIDQLLEVEATFDAPLDALDERKKSQLLHRLQHSLAELGPMPVGPLDSSLQLHACHSPLRQAEVLHDRLLDLFQRHPDLAPGDVLVLCADIDAARPALESVFGSQEEGRRIPWAMARQGRSDVQESLLGVLELLLGRRQVDEVLAPLACAPLRRKLGLEAADLPLLADWCRLAGIVWGLDAQHRERLDLPPTDEHSWRAGLDRLVLGHAMEAGGGDSTHLPVDEVAGRHALLEALLAWHHALEALRLDVQVEREPAQWMDWLLLLLPRLLEPFGDGEKRELDALRRRISEGLRKVAAAGSCGSVGWPVALDALRELLQPEDGAVAGLDGRLTMLPMLAGRGLPARVVVLFGLDDQAFPRAARRDELDLCQLETILGDRQPREQDRGQFLDAICAAQDALLIFWQGLDPREGRVRPPSVVVGEVTTWLEWCTRRIMPKSEGTEDSSPDLKAVRPRQHPMQGFSERAYATSDEASFHMGRHTMANALKGFRATGRPRADADFRLWQATLPETELPQELEMAQLLSFYRNPARSFLRRAGVRLPWDGQVPPRHEPFSLDHLTRGMLRNRLLQARLEGREAAREEKVLRAEGLLPWGRTGQRQLEELQHDVESALGAAREACGAPLERTTTTTAVDTLTLKGEVWQGAGTLVLTALGSDASRQRLPGWIQHLAWQLAQPDPPIGARRAVLITLDKGAAKAEELPVPEDALAQLREILAVWRLGQHRWMPWFQRASEEMAQSAGDGKERERGLLQSMDWFQGREYLLEDAWVQLVLDGTDPLCHPFLATQVLDLACGLGALLPPKKASGKRGAA